MQLTSHVKKRMQQRGFRSGDVELIERFGTQLRDGFLMRGRDVDAAILDHKGAIHRLEHLRDRFVVVVDGRVLSAYVASRSKQKRLLS